LGGTSSINGMVYMRGTPTDYDGWRQRGCEGWDYDSVLPFFKKAEDQERGPNEFHGTGGPLRVSNPVRSPLGDAMVKASIEAGVPANDDFNGAKQEGVGYYQTPLTTAGAGARHGVSARYQKPREPERRHRGARHRVLVEGDRAVGSSTAHRRAVSRRGRARDRHLRRRLRLAAIVATLRARAGELLQELGIAVVRDMPGVARICTTTSTRIWCGAASSR